MKCKSLVLTVLLAALAGSALAQTQVFAPAGAARYGANPLAGSTFIHDGLNLYYEEYGTGEPLLLIHGNGGSIGEFAAQIDYFRKSYRVIAMDSRDQGQSDDSLGAITYEKMTGDLAALLDHLKIGPVNVLGWSDGGIEALELGMYYPNKVKKIAAMAPNLEPDGLKPEVLPLIKTMLADMPPETRNTTAGRREVKVTQMMFEQPHIPLASLEKITTPILILAGDHDLTRDEHILAIFHHIPNAELAIFPNATHMIPYDDPALFNATVERFFKTPYKKKDHIQDAVKSEEAMENSLRK